MEALDIVGQSASSLSINNSSAVQSSSLPIGIYKVWSTVDCRIRIDPSNASGVTATNGDLLFALNTEFYHVGEGQKIGVIAQNPGETGTFFYHWVGRRAS